MASCLNLLFTILFLIFCALQSGNAAGKECKLSSIEVSTSTEGKLDGFDTVFEVTVKNHCSCTVSNVTLSSNGFITSMAMNPKDFRLENGRYLVNDGKVIAAEGEFKFRYAWDHWWWMYPVSFRLAC